MEDQKINIETAKLAHEKGLNLKECQCVFVDDEGGEMPYFLVKRSKRTWYRIPTQSLLQKWLRETYNIHIEITVDFYKTGINYNWQLKTYDPTDIICSNKNKSSGVYCDNGEYKTYELALEAALYRALTYVD